MDFRTNNISICAGGGGLDLAVELAMPGARSVCFVEREAFACERLVAAMQQGHLAPAPIWTDARSFRGRPWRGHVDGVFGGIPCQPHSLAGKRGGIEDDRDLFGAFRRTVVQSGAWWCLIENVGGMLSSREPGVEPGASWVRRSLLRMGWSVEGGLFTAAEAGASHERERLFVLGVADAGRPGLQRRELSEPHGSIQREPASGSIAQLRGARLEHAESFGQRKGWPKSERRACGGSDGAMGHADSGDRVGGTDIALGRSEGRAVIERPSGLPLFPPGPGDLAGWADIIERWPAAQPAVRRMADGLADRVDLLRMLGNGVVPLEGAYAFRTLATRLAARGSSGADRLVRLMV